MNKLPCNNNQYYYRGKFFKTLDDMKKWHDEWNSMNANYNDLDELTKEFRNEIVMNLGIYKHTFTNADVVLALEKAFMVILKNTVYKPNKSSKKINEYAQQEALEELTRLAEENGEYGQT